MSIGSTFPRLSMPYDYSFYALVNSASTWACLLSILAAVLLHSRSPVARLTANVVTAVLIIALDSSC